MPSSTHKLTSEIRENFQKYFEKNGHTRVASSSLVPANDPTLLFTNAGMVPFKDCFLGIDKRPYKRATSSQKCVRAGGKHNDLENVGFTARHHTFFEMLGNFSFGDYFKKEAIHYAWNFVTKELGLPKDKLRVSVFESDDESADIWHKQEGVPLDRIVRFGEKDNFWAMGDTGPCGPCTEIFWDQGSEVDGDRWLEFWNCVFMQYDRGADGRLTPLPAPSVDTGMGLERMAAVLQGVPSNYDIDLMRELIGATQELASRKSGRKIIYKPGDTSIDATCLRVIVDHLRSTSFLIADGVLPSNDGRGYVLRRILRRGVRFGKRLGLDEPFLCDLLPDLISTMGQAFPELNARKSTIREILEQEESKFFETLTKGLELLDSAFDKAGPTKTLPADITFKLYDTFGFPVDLTALIAREKNFTVDEVGFDKLMNEQRSRARKSWKGSGDTAMPNAVKEWKSKGVTQKFIGYEQTSCAAQVLAHVPVGNAAWVAIDPCPFYAEGGGQMGDRGWLVSGGETLNVLDCVKPYDGGFALFVEGADLAALLKTGTTVQAKVDERLRAATKANHTATHLLHAALRKFLGTHVEQAGSFVSDEKLRFDFSHPKPIAHSDLEKIEQWVNESIAARSELCVESLPYQKAIERGALALFGEKYGDVVRMVQVPGFSTELCGGTHVSNTGDIRLFKITSESAVATGTRRIEAVTRQGALDWYSKRADLVERMAHTLKTPPDALEDRVQKLLSNERDLERKIDELKKKLASGSSGSSVIKGQYQGKPLEVHLIDDADAGFLRSKGDALRKANPKGVSLAVSGQLILVTVEPELTGLHAGQILKDMGQKLPAKGGGQAQTAQGQFTRAVTQAELEAWAKG